MEYTVVGFPRIGEHRELKQATEAYFRGEKQTHELLADVERLRAAQWEKLRACGAAFIPSNDFSLYDGMLDTAWMLNAIPGKYARLGLDEVGTYFAMARGYQGEHGDVTALAMKKWFNTNYHYMVPEISETTTLCLRHAHFLDGYEQAKHMGIETRPVVVGPYTFLKLARSSCDKKQFIASLAGAYAQLLKYASSRGVQWVQFDEPALVLDMTAEDVALLGALYESMLADRPADGTKLLVQTYFGDVRDCYERLCALPVDGIGLDFVEGKLSAQLMAQHGFPADKTLFAGAVNGKNVWRCRYRDVLEQLRKLCGMVRHVVLSTSCSLLHVPYTVAHEPQLSEQVRQRLAFAYEKLEELRELCRLVDLPDCATDAAFLANEALHAAAPLAPNPAVQQQVASLTPRDFKREMPRRRRQALQRETLRLPLLPTTTIGSFPQTASVKRHRARWRKGEISTDEYAELVRADIKRCIALQEELGLDVLVHGEYERNDMVEYFGENLAGFVFTRHAWVQSYGTRATKPPIIVGDISRMSSITTSWITYAASLTQKPVKGMLTGPVTIFNWSFPREDVPPAESMYQIALALREEVLELEAAGIRIIQIDEAALREKLPLRRADWHREYLDFALRAFRLCHSAVQPVTQIHTHMCYSEFEDIIPYIDAMDADVITFEASRSKLSILRALVQNNFETEVGPGVYDIHSPRVPSVTEIAASLKLMLRDIPANCLWVNPDCGLKTRGEPETIASLKNMVQAASCVRDTLR